MEPNIVVESTIAEQEERSPSSFNRAVSRLPLYRALPINVSTDDSLLRRRIVTSSHSFNYSRPIQPPERENFRYIEENILSPWLSNFPRSEMLTRHNLYKLPPIQFAEFLPKERYIQIKPLSHGKIVHSLATFKQFLLIGMSEGQIVLYDVISMKIIRVYHVKKQFGISQIITGMKETRFFVTCFSDFIEFSYFDDVEKFRFRNQYYIIKVLTQSNPMLIVDSKGYIHYYRELNEENDIQVQPVPGLVIDSLSSIEEIGSYDPFIQEHTRPCLLKNQTCIAIVNLMLSAEPKLSVWRKEIISPNLGDTVLVCCSQDKYFYTLLECGNDNRSPVIYASKLREIGRPSRNDLLFTSGGLIHNLEVASHYLLAHSKSRQLEIFDTRTCVKVFHINFKYLIMTSIILNDILIVGTFNGGLISQKLFNNENEVCRECEGKRLLEADTVKMRCIHYVMPEPTTELLLN